jgi:hypothetical protein
MKCNSKREQKQMGRENVPEMGPIATPIHGDGSATGDVL